MSLLANDEPEEEIRPALTVDVRSALPIALAAVRRELQPAQTERERAELLFEAGKYLRYTGFTDAQRDDFLDGVMEDLGGYPRELVLEAVRDARRRVRAPWDFVPWVVERIEPDVDRLVREESQIAKLEEIARS